MSISGRRLAPEDSRAAALEAARALLIEEGPQAVTLKAVAARVGRTHANVIHHFGSAAGLQAELARSIAAQVTGSIARSVELAREGKADPREIVDKTFDAFGREGAGALAAWMILTGNRDALDPILEAIGQLVRGLSVGHEGHDVPETTQWLVLLALGDSLLGQPVAEALGLSRDSSRLTASARLKSEIEARHPPDRAPDRSTEA
ncbi:MAG TPA: TetR family transcriptional regulator [Sphingomicrobium sp.]|jgi:AcrR family transcriptional regulator|nr:TetR family transcriptional regulator [Sphingomicrobium sp.]